MATRTAILYQGEDLAPTYDYTDSVIWEESEFGTRAWQGEGSASTIVIRDPLGEQGQAAGLPSGLTVKLLSAKNLFVVKVGSDWLFRGRVGIKNYSRDGQQIERYRQVECELHDTNWDLDHITVHDYARPSESDKARTQGLIASYLSGSPRQTTVLNGSNYISGSNLVTLPAKTYTRTTPLGILREIGETANKQFFVTGDSIGGGSLFWDGNDSTAYACTLSISDRQSEVNNTTVFAPIWNVGPASTEDGSQQLDEVVLFYGTGENDYVTVHDQTVHTQYGHASEIITDDTVTSASVATARANSILAHRKYEDRTYNVTIGPLTDAQVVLVKHGQTISIKARAIPDADDIARTMRIVQCRYTTPVPGTWFAHLQLGRPWKMQPYGSGPTLVPQPATEGGPAFTGTCATSYAGSPNYVMYQASVADAGDVPCRATDGSDTTWTQLAAPVGASYTWIATDLLEAKTMASTRLVQYNGQHGTGADEMATSWVIEASDNWGGPSSPTTGTWSNITTVSGAAVVDSGVVTFAPATHRYWRIRATAGGVGGWVVCTWDLTGPSGGISIGGPGESTGGDTGTYVPGGTVIEHGDQSGKGGTMHDATQIEFTPTGTVAATNVQTAIAEVASEGLSNPMTTAGDIIRGGASGTPTRLAIGGSNTRLGSDGAVPLWTPKLDLAAGTNVTLSRAIASNVETVTINASGGGGSLTVEEVDGTPSVSASTLVFPNGTLTDNGGGEVEYTPAGGGGGVTIQYPALKPATPTYDFADAALDGAFSAHSTLGSFTTSHVKTQGVDWVGSSVELQFSAQNGQIYVAHGNTDLDFSVGGIMQHGFVDAVRMFGIAALNSSGTGIGVTAYTDGQAYFSNITTWGYVTGTGSNLFGIKGTDQDRWWMRLTRVSGTWRAYVSVSGRVWDTDFAGTTKSDSITVDRLVFGMFYNPATSYYGTLSADYFHVAV